MHCSVFCCIAFMETFSVKDKKLLNTGILYCIFRHYVRAKDTDINLIIRKEFNGIVFGKFRTVDRFEEY